MSGENSVAWIIIHVSPESGADIASDHWGPRARAGARLPRDSDSRTNRRLYRVGIVILADDALCVDPLDALTPPA